MTQHIKAIILDVDGVIVGEKIGFNSPHPHPHVVQALKKIKNDGIPICLCTAKPHFAISKEIKDANLDNIHITDGGSVIIDPVHEVIVKQNNVHPSKAVEIIKKFIDANIYTEFYTVDDYFIQKTQAGDITEKHAHVIQSRPKQVDSLINEAESEMITKIMPIAVNEESKFNIIEMFRPFQKDLVLSWGIHPVVLPLQFGIITAKGVSKKQGAIEISKSLNVSLENILGVGDSSSDWQFIDLCGYGSAMGNADQELKDNVENKGADKSFIAPSVNENGIIEVFKYFSLL